VTHERESLLDALSNLPRLIREQEERDGICGRCHGMGGSYVGDPNGVRMFTRNCPTCKGTGRV
jgi:hypothetical protein